MTEHIVALFHDQQAADTAARNLEDVGISASAIRQYRPEGGGEPRTVSVETNTESRSGGFWAWLFGEEDAQTTRTAYPHHEEWYERRADAGSTILSVMVTDDGRIHEVTSILESHHPIEMEESTEDERLNSAPIGSDEAIAAALSPSETERHLSEANAEEVIPLAEETLEVGKRTVDRGTTRVRRYVVQTPVEREVTLQGERVSIERRKPVENSGPGQAFEEHAVEVHETEEVPVVEKTARVVEEVVIRKEATERRDTVRDTVRREEIEVSPQVGNRTSP